MCVCESNDKHIFCANGNARKISFKGQMLQWQTFRWIFFVFFIFRFIFEPPFDQIKKVCRNGEKMNKKRNSKNAGG